MGWRDDLERILAPDYLGDTAGRSIDDLRQMAAESQAVGDDISYLRRQVQGRLDIVRWELERRQSGEGRSTTDDLVKSLSSVLSPNVHAPGHQQMVDGVEPAHLDELTEELSAVVPPVWKLPDLDDVELRTLADRLEKHESEYSSLRREVFSRADALRGAITGQLGG
ncbi:MAG: hypothetical protein ACR2LJ_10850 [Acidimicrobiales bacterium]